MPIAEPIKDVTIRVRGEYRKYLMAIEQVWPVPQTEIIGAALMRFSELAAGQQMESFRKLRPNRRRSSRPEKAAASA